MATRLKRAADDNDDGGEHGSTRVSKRERQDSEEASKVPIDADVDIAAATKLQRDGYVTISMLPTAEARAAQRVAFTDSFLTFPEYLRDPADATRTPSGQPLVYVAGGFGALANPGSFHCDNAREIRECILAAVISLLGAYARLPMIAEWLAKLPTHAAVQLRKVAVFMERNSVRSAGTSVSADSVHFDSSPKGVLRTGDVVFGCVLNVNEDSIPFRCVPGTHLAMTSCEAVGSFEPVHDKALLARYKADMVEVAIPPGDAIVFFQHIVHEVAKPPRELKADSYRFMCGLLLTNESAPPFDVTDTIQRQAVPQIKSGQVPPVYSRNHRSAFLNKAFTLRQGYKDTLLGWCSKTFKPSLLVEKTHGVTGHKYRIVPMTMPSLADAGLPLYRDYDAEERAVFVPATEFRLKTFFSNGVRESFMF